MTRSIYWWTRWNSSVISCSEIESSYRCRYRFFFTYFYSGDVFWVYLSHFILRHFILFFTTRPIPFLHLTSIDCPITWVCRIGFISDLKCIRLFSNLIGSRSLIDKHCHTSGIGRVVTNGKIILSSFLFLSCKLNLPWDARTCQLPVYPGCKFTSGTTWNNRLRHTLPLYWIFNP